MPIQTNGTRADTNRLRFSYDAKFEKFLPSIDSSLGRLPDDVNIMVYISMLRLWEAVTWPKDI